MLREVERHCYYDHAEEEEEERVYKSSAGWSWENERDGSKEIVGKKAKGECEDRVGRMGSGILKMNFSVGVNMYREKVTCFLSVRAECNGGRFANKPHTGISCAEAIER